MNKLALFILIITTSFSFSYCQNFESITAEIVQYLKANKPGKIHKTFAKKTKKSFKKIFLVGAWKSIVKSNGALTEVGESSFSTLKDKPTATIPFHFEKSSLNLVLTANEKNEIVGLRFTALGYTTPNWAKNKVFGKERLVIETDTFKLPGELLLPENCNNCPVVILVHGSGPSDRNEGSAFSPNRLFQDLAYGFALNGIATIRYDKRTLVYQKSLGGLDSFTLYEETIADAVSAVAKAKSYSFLDSSNIYVLGHSLGAYASPLIAKNSSDVAGIIMLAGPHRALYEIIPEQYNYLFTLDGKLSKKEIKHINTAQEEVKFINGEASEVDKLTVMGDNRMLYYFRALKAYDPISTINNLSCRVLITQGDRDYQVQYKTEFTAYQNLLVGNKFVDFQLIPNVNHQMIWGNIPSTPNEYFIPGHPSVEVIQNLSDWVLKK